MRLSSLLLVALLPLLSCDDEVRSIVAPRSAHDSADKDNWCDTSTGRELRDVLAAFDGACAELKDSVMACCHPYQRCIAEHGPARKDCGLTQAKCIDRAHAKVDEATRDACQFYTDYVRENGLRDMKAYALVPELGVRNELYARCDEAREPIDNCVRELKACMGRRANRPKASEGEEDRQSYECSDSGKICLETVQDIDRTYDCAQELGYAMEAMDRKWRAIVGGKNGTAKDQGSTRTPIDILIDGMRKHWGMTQFTAIAVIVGSALGCAAFCCGFCYFCAIAGLKKEKKQRRWARQQRKLGEERYSNTETAQPSSFEEVTEVCSISAIGDATCYGHVLAKRNKLTLATLTERMRSKMEEISKEPLLDWMFTKITAMMGARSISQIWIIGNGSFSAVDCDGATQLAFIQRIIKSFPKASVYYQEPLTSAMEIKYLRAQCIPIRETDAMTLEYFPEADSTSCRLVFALHLNYELYEDLLCFLWNSKKEIRRTVLISHDVKTWSEDRFKQLEKENEKDKLQLRAARVFAKVCESHSIPPFEPAEECFGDSAVAMIPEGVKLEEIY